MVGDIEDSRLDSPQAEHLEEVGLLLGQIKTNRGIVATQVDLLFKVPLLFACLLFYS